MALTEVGTLIRGRGGSKADAVSEGMPCIRYGELYTHHHEVVRRFHSFIPKDRASAYTALQPGDVVFAGSGETFEEIGKAAAFCGDTVAYTSGDTIVLRPGRSADGRFLGYAVNSASAARHKSRMGQGSSVIHISAKHIGEHRLRLPPLPEQRRIAEILDTLDDLIRKTEQLIAKLRQVKQGLLHDLLTRGIDENGELRDPERHPEQFKDSLLGRIPKGWEVGGLLDLGSQERQPILTGPFGAQLGSHDFTESGVPVLRIGNVQWGFLDLSTLKHVTPQKAGSLSRFRVRRGDLLFARQGATTGRNALADERADGFLINYHIIRVATDPAICAPTYLYSVFNSPIVQTQVDREKGRSTREGVSTKTLTSFVLPIPTLEEQQRTSCVIEAHDERQANEERNLDKLRRLKSGLMEDLLTGRVRVTTLDSESSDPHFVPQTPISEPAA